MMMPTCSLSRAARSTATLSFWKHNVAFRNLVIAPRSNHLSSSVRTAKNLNLRYKRSFSGNGRAPLPPTPRVPPPPPSQTWFQTFLAAKEIPPRNTPKWYLEMLLITTVFGITGTSTMMLVSPFLCFIACQLSRSSKCIFLFLHYYIFYSDRFARL
jgi:hypothetical protein